MAREFVRAFRPGLLVCRPQGVMYGHLGMELAMAFARARAERASICVLKPRRIANPAYAELEGIDIHISRPRGLTGACLRAWWFARDLGRSLVDSSRDAWTDVVAAARDQLRTEASEASLDPEVRRRVRLMAHGLEERHRALRADPAISTPYLRRRDIVEPVRVRLPPAVEARAIRLAEQVGITPGTPLVTVHAREPGYKRGREVHEKDDFHTRKRPRDDSSRNVAIETFFPAMDFLVSRGFTVVRIGDPTMVTVSRPGVVDLATSPGSTPELEAYCLLNSTFLMGGESGPTVMTYLTNTPTLTVNATDPISSFPVRRNWLYVTKRVADRDTAAVLTLREMLTERYLLHLRDTGRFTFIDNSSDEIVQAVREMLARVAGDVEESDKQREYRRLATHAAETLKFQSRYIGKWGTHDGFLGHGAIARFFAEEYF